VCASARSLLEKVLRKKSAILQTPDVGLVLRSAKLADDRTVGF